MNHHHAIAALGAALPLVLALSACGGDEGSAESSKTPSPAQTATPTPSQSPTTAAAADTDPLDSKLACARGRGGPGEIFVWSSYGSDQLPDATQLGAAFVWNGDDQTCLTPTEFAIAGAQTLPGFCTEVGTVADNPGYDVNARPAARLTSVIAKTGDCETSPEAVEDVKRASGRKGG